MQEYQKSMSTEMIYLPPTNENDQLLLRFLFERKEERERKSEMYKYFF